MSVTGDPHGSSYFSGRVALVTGGGSGVGAAAARMMAHCGARVYVVDIDGDRAKAVADEIDGIPCAIDVADPPSWDALAMDQAPSVAFLNAGIVPRERLDYDLEDLTRAEVTRALGGNFLGVLHGLRRLLPAMRDTESPRICMNASAAGIIPLAADPLYGATKHALVGLGLAAAGRLGATGVHLTTLCPTAVESSRIADPERRIAIDLWGGLLPPSTVAQAALDLLEFGAPGEIRLVRPDGVHRVETQLVLHALEPSDRTAGMDRPVAE